MEIAIGARVLCSDGPCGRSSYVIVNPISEKVTHVVVRGEGMEAEQRLVPTEMVQESTPQEIKLSCSKAELMAMKPFIEYSYDPGAQPFYMYGADQYWVWPYAMPAAPIPSEHRHVPPGELAIERGASVQAADGHVGHVDEFLVDPGSGQITHLVLREGHLWGRRDVTIPVSAIDRIEDDIVYLKLDKAAIAALPAIPVRRPKGRG
jgi:sporulation protein YlmC with PRC-barrel domain